jgi:hypothetical protein
LVEGRELLHQKFRTCDPMDAYSHDVQWLFESLAGNFMGVTQYDEARFAWAYGKG